MSKFDLDPVKYEIFYNRLEQALIEAKETVKELSASIIVRDAGEVAQGFFLLNGDSVLMATGLLIHVQTIQRAIKYMINDGYVDDIGFNDGDQFLNNNAHIGGMHMSDMEVMAPVYYKGEHVGWTGNFSHIGEVGAIEPGGMCASSRESYHEGINLPCIKIVTGGNVRRDLLQMMSMSVRNPRVIDIDTRAKIAGNERAKRKIVEVIEEFGIDFFKAATQQLVKDAELQAEARIKTFHPGTYRARVYVDSTGIDDKLDSIESEVEVAEDGRLKFTTPVVPQQRKGINNCALPALEGDLFGILLSLIFYKGRWNGGTLKRVELDVPSPSALNASHDAAVAYGVLGVGAQFMVSLNDSLSRMLYASGQTEDIMAGCSNIPCCIYYGGVDQFGRMGGALALDCLLSPGGARFDRDGMDAGAFQYNPWSEAPDIEAEEMDGPILYLGRSSTTDSGGFGKFRGGSAIQAVSAVHKAAFMVSGGFGSGSHLAGMQGLFGGYPGGRAGMCIAQNTDLYERAQVKKPLPHRVESMASSIEGNKSVVVPSQPAKPFKNGDIVGEAQWGAPGLGDPIERATKLVLQDLRDKFISMDTVKNVYCVEIDPETFTVDEGKTAQMRLARKKERLEKGIPAKEFIKEMVKKRKERDLPPVVLDYLDEMSSFCEDFRNQLEFEEKLAEGV